MSTHAAFLRGMNVGKRRITNVELCAAVEELGFGDVGAFLASGNVAFTAEQPAEEVTGLLVEGLEEILGYPVPTYVRSAAEVRAVASAKPFADRPLDGERGKIQVAFLQQRPDDEAIRALDGLDSDDDWLTVEGRELYWWPIAGLSTSDLDLKAVARAVGEMTIRTQRTVERMAGKFFAD